MEKAYDLKVLIKKLGERGADLSEEVAKALVEETLDWVSESAVISTNKVDDIIAPFIPNLKTYVIEQLDSIDGKEG